MHLQHDIEPREPKIDEYWQENELCSPTKIPGKLLHRYVCYNHNFIIKQYN